jgi:hypothetical protein
MSTALTPVDRANALLAQMTLAQKLTMMHQGASCDWGAMRRREHQPGHPAATAAGRPRRCGRRGGRGDPAARARGRRGDLNNIDLSSAQNQLVTDVAAANPNTVVVVNSGSAITMPWANSVKGIIENWYPGQTDGTAIAALLYGDVNFSGKLPVTFPQSLADVPASTPAQWPGQNGTVQYSEGLDVGYRWYDAQNKTPLFPFGYGLSYTSFGYSNLSVGAPDSSGNVAVGFDVTNTAAVIAAGRTPRRGIADLMIAAIAIAEDLPLYTTNPDDFTGLEHLLTIVPVTRPHLPQHR